jgi:hypothetical protein
MKYQARDAIRVSGLSYRQLDYCIRSGLMLSCGGGGHGFPRGFRLQDLLALALLREVLRAGIPARAVAPALRLVQRARGLPSLDQLGDTAVWTDGRAATLVRKGEVARKPTRTISYVLDLGTVAERVNARLQKIAIPAA